MSTPVLEYRDVGARSGYRTDLDGLRGVAVGLVVVYHVWFGRVSGGVDVFLCLSGFFFGAKMIRIASDSFIDYPWWTTVTRLVRRLVPSLVTAVAGCVVMATVAYPWTRYPELKAQVIASLGYFQNIRLERTSGDYLAASAAASPLQHLWSMSVQGQFFLTVLVATGLVATGARLVTWNVRTILITTAAVVTMVSFAYAAVIVDGTGRGYYDGFARSWELLAGTLAGAVVNRINWSVRTRDWVSVIGVAGVFAGGFLVDGAAWFPGPAALVPVGATLALVLAGANQPTAPMPIAGRLLASRFPVWLGTIAYCLYLWHWPLLVMWLSWTGRSHAGLLAGIAVILVSIAAAWCTARLVESPLRMETASRSRRAQQPGPGASAAIVAAVTVLISGAVVVAIPAVWAAARPVVSATSADDSDDADLDPAVYPGARALTIGAPVPIAPVRPSLMEARQDVPVTTWRHCIDSMEEFTLTECRLGAEKSDRVVAVIGGSHSEHWIKALDRLGKRHGFAVVTYLKVGCPLSVGMHDCGSWPQRVLEKVVRLRPAFVFSTSTRPREDGPGDEVPLGYLPAWRTLSDAGIPVLAVRDTPWMDPSRDPADCLAMGGTPVSCGRPRDQVLASENPTREFTSELPLLLPLDLSDAVCRPDVCQVVEGNILVYRDSHHLSDTYVASMSDELWRQMSAATGWS